ncbi:MAG: 4-hydroxy-tetrahydrodipicolinate reductase, partial [Flavobacteriia bacterium]|nr:4-hydroxy-tetrahydrodipicolinate reductase [Flavobacteriia bacterium]
DAPSGTAITLAEGILAANPALNGWALQPEAPDDALPIHAVRKDPVPGTHTVTYDSAVDQLSLTHVAHSRAGFALGAVVAAERIETLSSGSHTFASLLFPPAR